MKNFGKSFYSLDKDISYFFLSASLLSGYHVFLGIVNRNITDKYFFIYAPCGSVSLWSR